MLKKGAFLLFLIIFVATVILGGLLWAKNAFSPAATAENYQAFVIPKGASANQIANKLAADGFIKSPLAFKLYTQLTGISKGIFAGEYKISPHMSIQEITKTLTSGPLELWVTIPEGLRREEIAGKFISGLSLTGEAADTFRTSFLEASKGQEGRLFPDTYLFPKDVTGEAVVKRMTSTFDTKMSFYSEEISASALTEDQIVTLASILERETKTDDERPMVAGILINRLDIGMALQVDAAVQYAVANVRCKNKVSDCDWWVPLTRADLDTDSPYNTYKYAGLPPAAIANPGLSSLKAVIIPQESEYYYYMHDASGGIHYGRTLEEHNANVRKYLNK